MVRVPMKFRTSLKFIQISMVLAISFALIACGCGGNKVDPAGNGSKNPLPSTQRFVTGQVLVPQEALTGRSASAKDYSEGVLSDKPVAGAIVQFTPEGSTNSTASITTDSQGNYQLLLPGSSNGKGLLKATTGNRVLEAILDSSSSGNVTRPITIESTVAVQLKKDERLKGLSTEALEDMVRSGTGAATTGAVIDAFFQNKPIQVDTNALKMETDEVDDIEIMSREDCGDGRLWCVLATRTQERGNNVFRAKILLIRMEKTTTALVPDGSVGAGQISFQWPAGQSPSSLVLAPQAERLFGADQVLFEKNSVQNETKLGFIIRNKDGFNKKRIALFQVDFPHAPPLENGKPAKNIVETQILRGVLSEKRSLTKTLPSFP